MKVSRAQFSIILSIFAVILWLFSILQAKFAVGKYGLIAGFPALYFFSLAILTLASAILWTSKEDHWKLLLMQLCFLFISLFAANLISGGAIDNYAWGMGALGNPEYILRTAHINPNFWQLWQANWPGTDIFQSVTLIITGNNIMKFAAFLPWFPVLWQTLLFIPVFVFFKNTLGLFNKNYIWAGMWIFFLASWPGLQTNGPQPLGIFFVFTVLAIFSLFDIWRKNVSSFGLRFSVIVIFAAVTVTHFLSSIVALSIVVTNFVSRRLQSYKIPVLAMLFVIIWAIFGATVYNSAKIPSLASEIFRLGDAFQNSIGKSINSSISHSAVSEIRIILTGMLVLTGILGGLIAFKQKQNRYLDISMLCVAISSGVVATAVGSGYGSELLNRFFIYTLPILIYFGLNLMRYRIGRFLLVVVLIICLPLTFIAQYGNQEMDYLTDGYINAADFFYSHTNGGVINGIGPLGLSQKAETYSLLDYSELQIEGDQVIVPTQSWDVDHWEYFTHYISVSDHDAAFLGFYDNQPELLDKLQLDLDKTVHCNIVFSNKNMSLYESEK